MKFFVPMSLVSINYSETISFLRVPLLAEGAPPFNNCLMSIKYELDYGAGGKFFLQGKFYSKYLNSIVHCKNSFGINSNYLSL